MAKIALAGGGTGGHVYPALAIGDELRARGHEVVYHGDPGRLEARVAPQRGYEFHPVRAMAWPRGGLVGKMRFALGLLRATWLAMGDLRKHDIDLVLGVGGYISAPTVLAAAATGRGRAVHEANVVLGLANKLCARVAQRVFLTYEQTRNRVPGSAPRQVVGVPVNPAVLKGDRAAALAKYGLSGDRPVVVFVGGSLGAQRLNDLALALARAPRSCDVVHICGPRYYDDLVEQVSGIEHYTLVRYEDRMADAYAAADLVVCRAGSSTLAELSAAGKPSVLVPSPNVTENHQEANARGLEASGAAKVVVEEGLDLAAEAAAIDALASSPETLKAMATAATEQARLDAASAIADALEELVG